MLHFGPPDQVILKTLVGERHYAECYPIMVKAFKAGLAKLGHYDGLPDTVKKLHALGVPQTIFTGRGRVTTDLILEHYSWQNTFVEVVTNDDVSEYKPHPEGILRILKNAKVLPANAIMIGDTVSDFTTAQAAGVKHLCAMWDAWAKEDREKLEKKGVPEFALHPSEVLTRVQHVG